MADRTRNQGKVPPPVPGKAGPKAAKERSLVGRSIPSAPSSGARLSYELEESTQQLTSPLTLAASEELCLVLLTEAQALEDSEKSPEQLAEVHARIALVFLQGVGDLDQCLRHCELASGHQVVTEILRSLAQGAETAASFGQYSEKVVENQRKMMTDSVSELMGEIACGWLFRFNSAESAALVAGEALNDEHSSDSDESESNWALETVYPIALSLLGKWEELAAFYEKRKSPAYAVELAALAYDRLEDSTRALDLIRSVDYECAETAFYASNLHSQILHSTDATPPEHVEFLETRLALLKEKAKTSVEINATRYALAQKQELAGQFVEAQKAFSLLTTKTGWSTSIAQLSALRVAYKQSDWKAAVSQLGKLSTLANEASLAVAHGRRRAEILECHMERKHDALKTWQGISENRPESVNSRRNILRLLLDKPDELINQVLQQASSDDLEQLGHWRLAIGIQETRLGDIEGARKLAEQCLRASRLAGDSRLTGDLWTVSRFRGMGEDSQGVAECYAEIAAILGESPLVAPLLLVSGLMELKAGREAEAISLLEEVAKRFPEEIAPLTVLASIHRSNSNSTKVRTLLVSIAEVAVSPDNQFDALVELGTLCIEQKDHAGARSSLTRASAIRPKDSGLLRTLAGLHENNHEWEQAVHLLLECAENSINKAEAAQIFARAGRLAWKEQGSPSAGIAIFLRGLALVPDDINILHACQSIYGELEQPAEQLAMYKTELKLTHEGIRCLAIHLEIGRTSALSGESTAKVLQAYQQALTLDPNSDVGLSGLLEVAKPTNNWNSIADAFRGAQESDKHLEILAEALRNLKDWRQYVEVQRRYVHLSSPAKMQARLSVEIGAICENELGDNREAISSYQKALEFEASLPQAHASLQRLHRAEGAWHELVAAIGIELLVLPLSEETVKSRIRLRLELAEVYRDELSDKESAITAFESVLAIDDQNEVALSQLDVLYSVLERDTDLLRIKVTQLNTVETSELTRQIADLRAKVGDVDGAIKAYKAALHSDIGNREVFSVLEKVCYGNERWTEALALYTEVIAKVESGETQAYQLSDLYSRRGQVQLQYMDQPLMAAASFLRVIEIEPTDHVAMQALSVIFSQSGDWVALTAAYEKRALLCSDTQLKLESYREAAEISRTQTKNREEMARFYKMILALDPADAEASEQCGSHYTETDNWSELILILESELARSEATGAVDVPLLKRIAKISEEGLHDGERAIRYYKKIVEHVPHSRRSLDALARIYETTERWMEFVDVTRRLVKVTKDRNVKALLYFKCGSVTEAKFGNADDAIRYYDAAIKTSPSCLPAVHGLRDLYLRQKEWSRVIQTLELEVKLWQDDKERAGVLSQIGRIYGAQLGQPDKALAYYKRALSVNAECVPANRALFEHYFELSNWDKAEQIAKGFSTKAMRDGDPMLRSEFYRKRGVVSMHTGNPSQAAESIATAIEIKQENFAAVQSLTELAVDYPSAYNYAKTYKELTKIYKKRGASQKLLAQVMVGEAQILMQFGSLHEAELLLQKAIELSNNEYSIAMGLVELHSSTRNWPMAFAVLENLLVASAPVEAQVRVLLKIANLYSEGPMDSPRAIASLQRILTLQPDNPEVYYLLAQELYCLEHFEDAKIAIERVIQLSAVPEANLAAERLARYTYFLGRILEKGGDSRSATSQYRRAAEYDPGYAPPALALAHHSMNGGDQAAAESRLISSALAAIENGDNSSAVAMQRGLARILLRGGDRDAAVEAYRGILEVEPKGAADRLSLAEIYAQSDLNRAIREVHLVIRYSLRHGPAYRVLAGYYMHAGKSLRAVRVLTAMRLLGYSEPQDETMEHSARSVCPSEPLNQLLTPELRMSHLANDSLRSALAELFILSNHQMTILNRRAGLGENLIPLPSVGNVPLENVVRDMTSLFGIEPEIYVGENVPGRIAVIGSPRTIIVLDRVVANESEACIRFALGWAFEGLCAGYSSLLHIGEKQRVELGALLRSLFLPEKDRPSGSAEFIASLPLRAHEILKEHAGQFQNFDMDNWMDGMNAVARRAGLLASDDLIAATRVLAILSGESASDQPESLGTVFCGDDLFQYLVSDEYDQLRTVLTVSRPGSRADSIG